MTLDDVLKVPPSRILEMPEEELNLALSLILPSTRPAEHKPINSEAVKKAKIKKQADSLMSLNQINDLIAKISSAEI